MFTSQHRLILLIVALAFSSPLAANTLQVRVDSNGRVDSISGTNSCSANSTCSFDISSGTFTEIFTAVPKAGFAFLNWQSGTGFLCPGQSGPCSVSAATLSSGDSTANRSKFSASSVSSLLDRFLNFLTRPKEQAFTLAPVFNGLPLVDAGLDQLTAAGATVQLEASAADSDGIVSGFWTQLSGPDVVVSASAFSFFSASFVVPADASAQTFVLQFTAVDGKGLQASDTVSIETEFITQADEDPVNIGPVLDLLLQ